MNTNSRPLRRAFVHKLACGRSDVPFANLKQLLKRRPARRSEGSDPHRPFSNLRSRKNGDIRNIFYSHFPSIAPNVWCMNTWAPSHQPVRRIGLAPTRRYALFDERASKILPIISEDIKNPILFFLMFYATCCSQGSFSHTPVRAHHGRNARFPSP